MNEGVWSEVQRYMHQYTDCGVCKGEHGCCLASELHMARGLEIVQESWVVAWSAMCFHVHVLSTVCGGAKGP